MKYLFIFLAFFASCATAGESRKDHGPLPLTAFYAEIKEGHHVLSPNGKLLAYIKIEDKQARLKITDLTKARIIHDSGLAKHSPSNLTWLSNDRLLFGDKGRVFAVNKDGSEKIVLISYLNKKLKFNSFRNYVKNARLWWVANTLPDDEDHILAGSVGKKGYQNLHRVNIYSGEMKEVLSGDDLKIHRWIIDGRGEVQLGLRGKKGKTLVMQLATDGKSVQRMSSPDSKINLDIEGKSYLTNRALPMSFSYTPNELYISENLSGDRFSISSYNFKTDVMTRILTDDVYDVGDSFSGATIFHDHQSKTLAGIRYERDKETTVWFDKRLIKLQATLDKKYPDKINTIVQWSRGFESILFRSWDEKSYGRIMVYFPKKRRMLVQSVIPPRIDEYRLSETTTIRYQAAGNQQIEAYLTLPDTGIGVAKKDKAASNKKSTHPLIVMPHGGPFVRTQFGFNPLTQLLASQGYAVIEPNYRGSTGYGRDHLLSAKASIHDTMIDDIAQSAKWAIAEGIADADRVYILGHSYGGYAAMMSSIMYPDLYQAAVSFAAPTDIAKQVKWYKKNDHHFAHQFWKAMVLGDKKTKTFNKKISPIHQLDNIKIPLYVFHGLSDEIVPPEHTIKLKELIEEKPQYSHIKTQLFKGDGHSNVKKSSELKFARTALDFFEENVTRKK